MKKLLWLAFFSVLIFAICFCFDIINKEAKATAGFFSDQTLFSYDDNEITVFNNKIKLKK